ncbi:conjugal transfer protein TraB [Allochromatium humboldtianum]|uniref:Conjugal transfer protein TraB n=1 Tax=Allochromatium humboldtianum TaxID=504901 RepID=A0A850RBW7_9GAMM|nr:TrbI/VirB10 family protein [Allochromatium humboldtianum]NVZ11514.1 conjugal transfer protein TraB [Allochromatium humboldtianum]
MNIVESYKRLNPGVRRNVLVGGVLGGVLAVSTLLMSMVEREAAQRPRADRPEVTVVSPQRMTGVEQFSAEMEAMKRQLQDLHNQTRELREQNEELKRKQREAPGPSSPDMDTFSVNEAEFFDPEALAPELAEDPPLPDLEGGDGRDAFALEAPPPFSDVAPSSAMTPSAMPSLPPALPPPMPTVPAQPQFRVISEAGELTGEAIDREINATEESADEKVYIPAGSMFTGVLLNGLDAPTTTAAQKNPTPVVMRIKREAVLPNYASIDVRECFLLAAGYGQLSSERVIMRAETLSCVRTDGQVFETKLDSYIVGTDGKVGMPGRLVSKQGQMIARSLLAGVFAGLGDALDVDKVSSLNIDPDGESIYEQENLSSVFQSGTASGLSSAANMVAKFYLDMAKETFPVVEVPAGEVGTIVVTRGGTLPLKGSTSLQLYADSSSKTPRPQASAAAASTPSNPAPPPPQAPPAQPPTMPRLDAAFDAQRPSGQPTFGSGVGW